MNVEHLLDSADRMIAMEGRRPRATDLRRAVSNAYYAMFHALARRCADQFVGSSHRSSESWRRVYRALQHGEAKHALNHHTTKSLDPAVDTFAVAFNLLQEARHVADYDPWRFPHAKRQVTAFVGQARAAIAGLNGLPPEMMSELAAMVLLKNRR